MAYLFLAIAIVSEVVATSALAKSGAFTRLVPSVVMVIGYVCAFACLSFAVRSVPIGIAYAIWSGVGILLISAVGVIWLGQRLDLPALIGLGLIVSGVVVVQLFSRTTTM
jgi:small multidrug resistance pump